jgi:hypothetical protein
METEWPESMNLPLFSELVRNKNRNIPRSLVGYIRKLKPNLDDNLLDLLDKMLVLNPD